MQWHQVADGVTLASYPMPGFGINFGRNVTLLRLTDGQLVIHSTAPFTAEDVEAIGQFGKPSCLVEATRLHDTFARKAQAAFPDIPYLAPAGFGKASGVATQPLVPPPAEWLGEIDVLPIAGLRWIDEHAFYHRHSRTLVVADLLFQFPAESKGWPRFFARHVMRLARLRGISAFFRCMIRDRKAFEGSMKTLLEWDFTQIVLAHREPILQEAKPAMRQALRDWGLGPHS